MSDLFYLPGRDTIREDAYYRPRRMLCVDGMVLIPERPLAGMFGAAQEALQRAVPRRSVGWVPAFEVNATHQQWQLR